MIDLTDKKLLETKFAEDFSTPLYPILADVGVHIDVHEEYTLSPEKNYFFEPEMDSHIAVLKFFPGLWSQMFAQEIFQKPV